MIASGGTGIALCEEHWLETIEDAEIDMEGLDEAVQIEDI